MKILNTMRPKERRTGMKAESVSLERMIKTAEVISDDSKEDEIGANNTVELVL